MEKQPTAAELMEFPCDHCFKAFGPAAAESDFAGAVHRAVCTVVPVPLDAIRARASSGGQYQCVTVLVRLHDFAQLEAIYAALRQVENLKFLL